MNFTKAKVRGIPTHPFRQNGREEDDPILLQIEINVFKIFCAFSNCTDQKNRYNFLLHKFSSLVITSCVGCRNFINNTADINICL